jgi:hypothetical protein
MDVNPGKLYLLYGLSVYELLPFMFVPKFGLACKKTIDLCEYVDRYMMNQELMTNRICSVIVNSVLKTVDYKVLEIVGLEYKEPSTIYRIIQCILNLRKKHEMYFVKCTFVFPVSNVQMRSVYSFKKRIEELDAGLLYVQHLKFESVNDCVLFIQRLLVTHYMNDIVEIIKGIFPRQVKDIEKKYEERGRHIHTSLFKKKKWPKFLKLLVGPDCHETILEPHIKHIIEKCFKATDMSVDIKSYCLKNESITLCKTRECSKYKMSSRHDESFDASCKDYRVGQIVEQIKFGILEHTSGHAILSPFEAARRFKPEGSWFALDRNYNLYGMVLKGGNKNEEIDLVTEAMSMMLPGTMESAYSPMAREIANDLYIGTWKELGKKRLIETSKKIVESCASLKWKPNFKFNFEDSLAEKIKEGKKSGLNFSNRNKRIRLT